VSQAPARPRLRAPHLNTGGKSHALINAAAAYTVVAGIVSLILGMLSIQHIAGTILGVTGMIIGLAAQMMSATRTERMVIVFGIVASFVGLALGFGHGGFT
jgi:hypothetical protein